MIDPAAFPIATKWPATDPSILQLYSFPTPNGVKASIMLEEIGLPYEAHKVTLSDADVKSPEFLSLNPNNKIPAIIDPNGPDGAPIGLFESGAILIYLAEKSDKFLSGDPKKRIETIQWLMWQMGGFGPMLGQAHYFLHFNKGVSEHAENRFKIECQRLYDVLDEQLEDNEFVAGEISIADFAIFPWAARHEWQQIDLSEYENVLRWYKTMAARSGVQAGVLVTDAEYVLPTP